MAHLNKQPARGRFDPSQRAFSQSRPLVFNIRGPHLRHTNANPQPGCTSVSVRTKAGRAFAQASGDGVDAYSNRLDCLLK
jgi:hypothetical protein